MKEIRCGDRRRPARRGEESRQGAHLLLSHGEPWLGSSQPTPRALASLQHAGQSGRNDAGLSAFQLDRARCVALYPGREHRGGLALLRKAPPHRRARRHADHGGRREIAVAANEQTRLELVRFRTLGCYPLTGAIRSSATTLDEVIEETQRSTLSERQGRAIDHDDQSSMERKKREGYF